MQGYLQIDEPLNCNFLECFAGCGVSGNGYCALNGEPTDPNCKQFQDEAKVLAMWEAEGA